MANKGSKFNKYTAEFKVMVVKAYKSGNHGGLIGTAKFFGIPSFTQIRQWIKIYNEQGAEGFMIETRGRGTRADGLNKGRPKKVSLDDMTKDEQIAYLKMENEILKKVQALRKR